MRRVKVETFEDEEHGPLEPARTLVFGTDEAGTRVAFHVPRHVADVMRAELAAGNQVEAELPDGVDAETPLKELAAYTQIRRVN